MASYFFVGIGGSGMLPLAEIVAARGHRVAGSDRSLDQGRLAAKFEALAARGVALFPQDGSGIVSRDQIVVASAAVEAHVADIVRATELGCARMTRAELLAQLFNVAPMRIAVGGTSGKSTVTGMIGWIMDRAGHDPTIMNGALMKSYGSGARVGGTKVFISEVDESDGSIALYRPTVAVLNNVSLDHKSMDELRMLFGNFVSAASHSAINVDDAEARALATGRSVTFGMRAGARLRATDLAPRPDGIDFTVNGMRIALAVPGAHNVSNALAALAAAQLAGVPLAEAATALESFTGLKRRFDVVGTANGVTVIDDFAHNPDKVTATLATLTAFPGRVLLFFQPHGFGPLMQMGDELAAAFAGGMRADDRLIVCDPVYFGGTVARERGGAWLAAQVRANGAQASFRETRDACGDWLIAEARPGDRIVTMGARDDTLSLFAEALLGRLRPVGAQATSSTG